MSIVHICVSSLGGAVSSSCYSVYQTYLIQWVFLRGGGRSPEVVIQSIKFMWYVCISVGGRSPPVVIRSIKLLWYSCFFVGGGGLLQFFVQFSTFLQCLSLFCVVLVLCFSLFLLIFCLSLFILGGGLLRAPVDRLEVVRVRHLQAVAVLLSLLLLVVLVVLLVLLLLLVISIDIVIIIYYYYYHYHYYCPQRKPARRSGRSAAPQGGSRGRAWPLRPRRAVSFFVLIVGYVCLFIIYFIVVYLSLVGCLFTVLATSASRCGTSRNFRSVVLMSSSSCHRDF